MNAKWETVARQQNAHTKEPSKSPKIKGDKHNSSKKAGDEQRPQRKGNERKWYERDNGMQQHVE